jgi:predicted secreted protein
MRTITSCLFFTILITYFIFLYEQPVYCQQNKFGAGAVWTPSMDDMENIEANCGLLKGDDLYSCLIKEMQAANASDNAVEFTKLLGGKGYMKSFKKFGIIDIAYVYYPFENENRVSYVMVNGNTALVDPDDYYSLNIDDLQNSAEYIQLENKYPHISLFAGNRTGADCPVKEILPDNRERIIVDYALRNGCNHCELIGFAEFGFDFDSLGNFLGTKYLTINKSVVLDSVQFENSNPLNVFSDPSQSLILSEGQEFEISLQSNHSAGLKWELANPLDENVVTFLGSDFLIPDETLPNAAGKEIWHFKTTGNGATEIKFKYVKEWQNETQGYNNVTFTLVVN